MARIIYSLGEYAAIVENIREDTSRAAIDSMRKTRQRMDNALDSAAAKVGHLDRVGRATGYGRRAGAHVGHKSETGTLGLTLIVRATGPWQLRDNSRSGGNTAAHDIGPRPDANPRPLPPAKRYKPSLQMRSGDFATGVVHHPGSSRSPYWHNAVQSVQPTITKLFGDDWRRAIEKAVG